MPISLSKRKKLRHDYNIEKVNAMTTTSYQFSSSSQSSLSSSFSSTDFYTDNFPDFISTHNKNNDMDDVCSEDVQRVLINDENAESGQESDEATTDIDETDSLSSEGTDKHLFGYTEEPSFERSLNMKFKNSLKWLKLKDEINVGNMVDIHELI